MKSEEELVNTATSEEVEGEIVLRWELHQQEKHKKKKSFLLGFPSQEKKEKEREMAEINICKKEKKRKRTRKRKERLFLGVSFEEICLKKRKLKSLKSAIINQISGNNQISNTKNYSSSKELFFIQSFCNKTAAKSHLLMKKKQLTFF